MARWVRINGFVVQQVTLCVQTYHFASRAESGIDGQHSFLSQRRSQQKLMKITCKHADGFIVSLFLSLCGKLCFNGWFY